MLAEGEISVDRLADRLGVHARTARAMLLRLVLDGLAEKGPQFRDGFRATPALRELGAKLVDADVWT